jgi:hypothetical protein
MQAPLQQSSESAQANPQSPQLAGSVSVFVQTPGRQHVGESSLQRGPVPQKHWFPVQVLPDGPQFLFTQQTPVTQEPSQQIPPEAQPQLSIPPQPSETGPQLIPTSAHVRATQPAAGATQSPAPSRTRPLQHGLPRFGALPALVQSSLRFPFRLPFLPPRPRCD